MNGSIFNRSARLFSSWLLDCRCNTSRCDPCINMAFLQSTSIYKLCVSICIKIWQGGKCVVYLPAHQFNSHIHIHTHTHTHTHSLTFIIIHFMSGRHWDMDFWVDNSVLKTLSEVIWTIKLSDTSLNSGKIEFLITELVFVSHFSQGIL